MLVGLTGMATVSFAQEFPKKPIRLLVGYPPGGGVDSVARLLGPRLGAVLGQQVIIENRTGATGAIAADAVIRAAPDGCTLLLRETALFLNQFLQTKKTSDPSSSLAPVAGLFTLPLIIAANNSFPAQNPAELIAALRAAPGKYSYGTPGIGTVQHLAFEMLRQQTGTSAVHVPYRGASQIIPDLIGGGIPLGVLTATAALTQARAGKIRAVALLSPDQFFGSEGIPTMAQAIPGFNAAPRLSLMAPSGTPTSVIKSIASAISQVLTMPDLAEAAAQLGAVTAYLDSVALRTTISRESAVWGKVIRDQKITVE